MSTISSELRLGDLEAEGGRTSAFIVVLVEREFRLGFWEMDGGNLNVVVVVVGGVGPDEHAVHGVVLVGGTALAGFLVSLQHATTRLWPSEGMKNARLLVREPLSRERRPFKCVGDHEVVEERRAGGGVNEVSGLFVSERWRGLHFFFQILYSCQSDYRARVSVQRTSRGAGVGTRPSRPSWRLRGV